GERVRAADPAPGTRDDRDLATQIGHGERLLRPGRHPRDDPYAEPPGPSDVDVDRVTPRGVDAVRAQEVERDAVEADGPRTLQVAGQPPVRQRLRGGGDHPSPYAETLRSQARHGSWVRAGRQRPLVMSHRRAAGRDGVGGEVYE